MALIEEKAIDGYGNKIMLYAEETGVNTSGNYSSVHAWLDLYVAGSVASSGIRVGVSGANEVNLGYRSWGRGTHRLIDGYYNAQHNNDGSGSTYVSGYFNSNIGNWSFGGTLSLTKINRYPILNSGTNFTDEENPVYDITAFGLFPIRVKIEVGSQYQLITRDLDTRNSTTYTLELTEQERNTLRTLATTNTLELYETVCAMDGERELSVSAKKYKMTIVNGNPTFSNFDFEDVNTITKNLTGSTKNNVINVNGYSNIQATITTTNKAEAIKQATMSKYRLAIGDNSTDIAYSDNEDVSGVLNNASNGTYNLYAIDSRNNSTLVIKQATSVINYENVYLDKQNCSIVRDDGGVGDNATLTINGTFWNNNFGVVSNSIKSVSYRLKKTNSSTWITGTTTITPTTSGNTFSFTDYIASDNQDTTWDLDSSYNVEITVSDELSTTNVELILNSAVPTMSLDENGVGIMCAYDSNIGGKLQVDGINILDKIEEPQIIVKETYFTMSGSGTGWKTGSFTYSNIDGYKLVAVATRTAPSGDVNQFMYNIYTDRIYYRVYMGYDNYGQVNINLIYVKNSNIS